MPHVAIVILTWNGREDTLDCLESLQVLEYPRVTTVVVDNASTDGTAEAVSERYPDVELVASPTNRGFSGGNNLGLRRAMDLGAEYVLLLNNDTLVDPPFLHELVREARRRPDAGALCPIVYYADPPDLIWYAGAEFDPRRGHNGRQTGYRERDRGQYAEVREISRASGAAMLVPRPVLERVGLLDEEFFFHIEDVEWSLRIQEAGHRIYFVPRSRVCHKVSGVSVGENSPTIAYYAMRNTLEVCARFAPLGPGRALWRHAVTIAAHAAHARRGSRPLANLRAVGRGWQDYRRGRFGERGPDPA